MVPVVGWVVGPGDVDGRTFVWVEFQMSGEVIPVRSRP